MKDTIAIGIFLIGFMLILNENPELVIINGLGLALMTVAGIYFIITHEGEK